MMELSDEQLHELVEKMSEQLRLKWRREGEKDAYELMSAGWQFEIPSENSEPWQWYWRRPGPRGGRLYRSTSQAMNRLRKDRADD